jgi:hypothetical protein
MWRRPTDTPTSRSRSEGEELVLQPIDYVGESLLRSGRYTYVLNVTIEGQLTLDFHEDD